MELTKEAIRNGFRVEEDIVVKYNIEGRKRKNWRRNRGYSRQFIKDNCEKCGKDKNLTINHIVPLYKKKDYSEKNSQTLCRPCHDKIHNIKKNSYKIVKKPKVKPKKSEKISFLILEQDEWGSYRIID